jgi:hypothetical protein
VLSKNSPITICETTVAAGERASISLPIADLYTGTSLSMPVKVINGNRSGPVLFVCAAIHGDELNGVEIIRRLLKLKSTYMASWTSPVICRIAATSTVLFPAVRVDR